MPSRSEPSAPKKASARAAVAKSAPRRDLFGTPSSARGFSLRDVSVEKAQRAQELYQTNFEAFKSFHNFFASYNDDMYREIDTKHAMKRDAMEAWIAEAFGPDVLLCVNYKPNGQEQKKDKALELLVVAAALTKYDEANLFLRFKLGEMENLVTNHFRSYAIRSNKQQQRRLKSNSPYLDEKQVAHTLGIGLVRALVRNLPPEKRVDDQHLQVLLNRDCNMRLVVASTNQGLHKRVDNRLKAPASPGEAHNWTHEERERLKQIVKHVQSEQFQASMIEVRGAYLYDAIRSRLMQADPALWQEDQDQPHLRRRNILSREKKAELDRLKKVEEKRKELHLNTDLTPDRRFRGNRDHQVGADASPPPAPAQAKKPNRTRRENDGERRQDTPNSIGPGSAHPTPTPTRLKKDDTPDRRFRSTKSDAMSASSAPATSADTDCGREIFLGPRGGRFYFNANGKKVYI
jgi:hypothetical protein